MDYRPTERPTDRPSQTDRQMDGQRDCNIEMQGHIKKFKGVMNKQPYGQIGQQTDRPIQWYS